MADDILVAPSTEPGAVPAATDEVGGRHFQIVKLAIGADGVATLIDAAGLPISAAALPLPTGASTEATLAALKSVADTIATAAAAIQAAAEALNGKTTAVNTGAIAGTVALDATALAAIAAAATPGTQPISGNVGVLGAVEIVNDTGNPIPVSGTVATGLAQPLTDTQLRAAVIPVSAAALPLPTDAASETTLAAMNAKLPALSAGRIPVELPSGGGGLTDTELRASPVEITGSLMTATDFWVSVLNVLRQIADPISMDQSSGRLRVMLDATGGAQTLAAVTTVTTVTGVTTVSTVTNQAQLGGVAANSAIYDQMHSAWANAIRPRIT